MERLLQIQLGSRGADGVVGCGQGELKPVSVDEI